MELIQADLNIQSYLGYLLSDNNVISTLKNAVDIDWLWKYLQKYICEDKIEY